MNKKIYGKKIIFLIGAIIVVIALVWMITKKENMPQIEENRKDTQEAITEEPAEKKIDALSYYMDLTLDTGLNKLTELVTMEVKNNTDQPVSEICIRDMTPAYMEYNAEFYGEENANKKTELISIVVNGSDKSSELKIKDNGSVIFVNLGEDKKLEAGETIELTVEIQTDIPDRADRFGYQETEKGKLYALSFCFPYLADYENGEWQLDPFFDDGESRSHDLADYSVTFHAPESYVVAATGISETNNGETRITAENVRDFAIVACNFMEKESFTVEGIQVNNYFLDGKYTDEYVKISKAVAKDSIRIFTERIGKYPYEELDIVPCLFGYAFGGMEYPGLIMTNATSFYSGSFFDGWALADGVSHEIAHQWFYAAVGNREYREGWIDEGFATLLERDFYGLTECESHQQIKELDDMYLTIDVKEKIREEAIELARNDFKDIYLNVSPDEYPEEQSYGTAEYEGGYIFLQEVRKQIGDEAFEQFVREFYKMYQMKTAKTEDVLVLIRKYDNSEKMEEIIGFYFKCIALRTM